MQKGNIALMLAATIVALLLVEVALRVAGVSYPNFWRIDAVTGGALRPGAEGWWKSEGEAYIRINSAGLRDRERSIAKPPNSLRIAVLGDSYAEALQVPMELTFWSVLGRELERCSRLAGRSVDVVNFGVSGYGTAQELLTLRSRVWEYEPDIVLLAFVAGNDIRNNSRELETERKRPFFVLQDGRPVAEVSFRESLWFQLKQSEIAAYLYPVWDESRLFQLVGEALRIARARAAQVQPSTAQREASNSKDSDKGGGGKGDNGATSWDGFAEAGLDANAYVEPKQTAWKEAWQITEALIVMIRDEVKRKGADFLVVTLTSGPQVDPDPEARRAFQTRLGVQHLFYPDFRVRDLGRREGFDVLNLAPAFQGHAEQHRLFLHGFKNTMPGTGHWNADGHRLGGQMIAKALCERLGS